MPIFGNLVGSFMLETVLQELREQRTALADSALERLDARTTWSEADLQRLLDICDEQLRPELLDAIEEEGRQFAQTDGRIDVRLESIERVADALGSAIDAAFAPREAVRLAAREALRLARRTCITAIARGFQTAIERLALIEHERIQRVINRQHAVQRINGALNSNQDLTESLGIVAAILADELDADLAAIFVSESPGELTLRATNRPPHEMAGHYTIHLGQWITGEAAQQGAPQTVFDVLTLASPPIESQLFDRPYRGICVVPIIFFGGEGHNLEGAITLLSEAPRAYSPEEISFLELVAGQLAMSIENSHIYRHTDELVRQQIARISSLQRISATVATSFDLSRVQEMILSQAAQVSGASHGAIFQIDSRGEIVLVAHLNLDVPNIGDIHVEIGACCVGRTFERCDRVWSIGCMHTDAGCILQQIPRPMPDVHASLALPLLSKGQMQGVLFLLYSDRNIQPHTQARMVETFANEAAVAIESSNLYEETLHALEVKSNLLQEMHHRVKNNLLSIAAILRMEKRRTTAHEAVQVLAESISRIDGMAATHDLLSREERIGTARVVDIAAKLVGVVSAQLVPPDLKVDFAIKATGDVEVHSKKALALALVINELLSNAIEHGLKGRDQGRVRIDAWEANQQTHLLIADDGNALPPDLNFSHLASLGLPLVRDMARDQLRGAFRLYRAPLPVHMRDDEQDEREWTIAELVFDSERILN